MGETGGFEFLLADMKMQICATPSHFIQGTDKVPAKLLFSVVVAGVVCCVSILVTWKNEYYKNEYEQGFTVSHDILIPFRSRGAVIF